MRNSQIGFTLIELVMVIVILGILAAFALPKFADLSSDAELASAQGALGAVKSAAGIAHAAYLAGGSTNPTIEGVTYTMVNGYPQCEDIATLANLDGFIVDTATNCAGAGTDNTAAVSNSGCSFTYIEAAVNAAPTYSAVTCP